MNEATSLAPRARGVFNQYREMVVKHSIRRNPGESFAALPDAAAGWPIDDKVYDQFLSLVVDKAAFLKRIDMVTGLDRLQGNILRDNMAGHILKRTNVDDTVRRLPNIVGSGTGEQYNLLRAEFDARLKYDIIRHWAKKGPNFLAEQIRMAVSILFGNNLLNVGFQGLSDGDPPTGIADFAKGWLQLMRDNAPANVMTEVVTGSGKIFIGGTKVANISGAAVSVAAGADTGLPAVNHGFKTGAYIFIDGTTNYDGWHLVLASSTANQIDILAAFTAENFSAPAKATQVADFRNMDELAVDLVSIVPVHKRSELTCMVSDGLRAAEKALLYGSHGAQPSEKVVIERAFDNLAGYPVETPAFLPGNTLVATKHRNLSIYIHENWNRAIENKHEWKGVVFWNEFTEGYFVEDPDSFVMAENIFRI